MLFAAGQALDQSQGFDGLAPGPVGNRPSRVRDAPLGRDGGNPYDLDQYGGGNGFGGELHVRSLPTGVATGQSS